MKRELLALQGKVASLAYRTSLLHEKTRGDVPAYLQHCQGEYASAVDGITGARVMLDGHPVTIGFRPTAPTAPSTQEAEHKRDIRDVCRMFEEDRTGTSLVLVFATAGTGKTWLCRQAMRALSLLGSTGCVPLLVSLQDVVRLQLDFGGHGSAGDPLEQYIRAACKAEWVPSLLAAYRAQSLVVVLDGLDEVPDISALLVHYIIRQSGRKLRQCLLTSRPEGVPDSLIAHMRAQQSTAVGGGPGLTSVYDLLPLSWIQQQKIIRLLIPDTGEHSAGHFMDQLLKYMRARTEFDYLADKLDPAGLLVLEGSRYADFDDTRSKLVVQTTYRDASVLECQVALPLGMRFTGSAKQGYVVVALAEGGNATQAGILPGMSIVSVNGILTRSLARKAVAAEIKNSMGVVCLVMMTAKLPTREPAMPATTGLSAPDLSRVNRSVHTTMLLHPVETCDALLVEARDCIGIITEFMRGIANSVGLSTVESIADLNSQPDAAGPLTTNYPSNWRNIWIRDVFGSQRLWCAGAPNQNTPESRFCIKKFEPHFIYNSFRQASLLPRSKRPTASASRPRTTPGWRMRRASPRWPGSWM